MPRAKTIKKQIASDVLAKNGNDAPSFMATTTEVGGDAADGNKLAIKSKSRVKKTAAAGGAAGEDVNVALEADTVVPKKIASRGKAKPTPEVPIDLEKPEPVKPKRISKKVAKEERETSETKTTSTKSRLKKDKTQQSEKLEAGSKTIKTSVQEPLAISNGRTKKEKSPALEAKAASSGRAKKVKIPDEDVAATSSKESQTKSRGRKKMEPEDGEPIEAQQREPVKKSAKKEISLTAVKGKGKTVEEVTVPVPNKRARGTKRLADIEIAELIESVDIQAITGATNKNRIKQAKVDSEVPVKKRGKKVANESPTIEKTDKRIKKAVAKQNAENNPTTTDKKPVRGRKRQAVAIEDDVTAPGTDDITGSRTSKAKKITKAKAKPVAVEVEVPVAVEANGHDKTQLTSPNEKPFNLKISSWNVAGLRAWLKKDGLKFLEVEEPDIFCLQETKCANDQLPEEMTRLRGYHPYWLCMPGGYAGVAVYSKIMPINIEYGIGNDEFDDVGRMITAEYEKFYLINVYVPNSGRKLVNLEPRMRWEKLFQTYVQKLDALKPVVICGDMNVSHTEIDLFNPKTNTRNAGFTKEERDKMTELLALGFVDTFRHLYPTQELAYTFWTYMANARARNVGWRLDYCIVSERFISRIVDNVMRSQYMGSDHCPITVFLNV